MKTGKQAIMEWTYRIHDLILPIPLIAIQSKDASSDHVAAIGDIRVRTMSYHGNLASTPTLVQKRQQYDALLSAGRSAASRKQNQMCSSFALLGPGQSEM
jgi:hypothetical protein